MDVLQRGLEHAGLPAYTDAVTGGMTVILILFCLLLVFFGYRSIRTIIALIAFLAGFPAGYVIAGRFGLTRPVSWIIALAAGIGCMLIGHFLYRVGLFFAVLIIISISAYELLIRLDGMTERNLEKMLAILIGIFAAAMVVRFLRPMIIVVTSAGGGFSLSGMLVGLLTVSDATNRMLFILVIGALFAAGGVIYQLKHTSPARRRR